MSESPAGLSRRTLAKGAAWAAPAVAVAAAAPAHAASGLTTTLPPCVSDIAAVGGTYPVTYALSGCQTANSHWDFQFRITAATLDGTDCTCPYLRVTLFDNPKRTRLWIINPGGGIPDPSTNTNNSPRLYVTKVLAAGTSANFPSQGDIVRRVLDSPYTGYNTGNGTQGTTVGTIEAHGDSNDTLHVLMTPTGGLPCTSSGPMAYYRVECGPTSTGPWTQLGELGTIDPCTPMITATVCRFDTSGNGRYRLGVSVLNSCGLPASAFTVTDIVRNSNTNSPNGTSVYSGPDVQLGAGVTNIDMTTAGSGTSLWITFTTDGVNFSQIRVPTNNTACAAGPAPVLSLVSNSCTTRGTDTRTVTVSWTGTANTLERATNSTFTQNSNTTTVSGNSHSYSFSDNDCDTQYYFRVYQNGTTNYSNTVMSASGAGTQSLSAEEQSLQEQSVSSSEARVTETTTTTEAPTTTTTTAAPTTTTSTTAAPETTETPTDG